MWSRMSRRSSRALCDQLTLTFKQLGLYAIVRDYALSLDVGDALLDLLLHVELVNQIVPRSIVTKSFDGFLSCFLDRGHDPYSRGLPSRPRPSTLRISEPAKAEMRSATLMIFWRSLRSVSSDTPAWWRASSSRWNSVRRIHESLGDTGFPRRTLSIAKFKYRVTTFLCSERSSRSSAAIAHPPRSHFRSCSWSTVQSVTTNVGKWQFRLRPRPCRGPVHPSDLKPSADAVPDVGASEKQLATDLSESRLMLASECTRSESAGRCMAPLRPRVRCTDSLR